MVSRDRSIEDDIAMLFMGLHDREYKQTPVEFQLEMFGFDSKALKGLKGKRVLDVACGDGSMVRYLRKKDILAEGIDSNAPSNDSHFMKKDITSMGKSSGIPRPNKTYDLVISFQNSTINSAFTPWDFYSEFIPEDDGMKDYYNNMCLQAQMMVHEMVRTTKPGGKVLIFPSQNEIKAVMGLSLSQYNLKFSEEAIPKNSIINWVTWELQMGSVPQREIDRHLTRTAIQLTKDK